MKKERRRKNECSFSSSKPFPFPSPFSLPRKQRKTHGVARKRLHERLPERLYERVGVHGVFWKETRTERESRLPEKQETIEGALPFSLSLFDQRLSGGSGDEAERLLLSQTRGVPLTAEAAEKNEGGDSRRERERKKQSESPLSLASNTPLERRTRHWEKKP